MLRHALRDRGLPRGMEELIAIAGGAPARVEGPARVLGISTTVAVDSARFFVQEILLHPQADAYRVLGVSPDADHARIKRHYRALQQWLHPDRLANSPESVYSARVNRAWDLLRTPARREAFDATASTQKVDATGASGPAVGSHIKRWERVEHPVSTPWRPQLLGLAGLLGICGILLWLALRDTPAPTFPDHLEATRNATVEAVQPSAAESRAATAALTTPVNIPPLETPATPVVPPAEPLTAEVHPAGHAPDRNFASSDRSSDAPIAPPLPGPLAPDTATSKLRDVKHPDVQPVAVHADRDGNRSSPHAYQAQSPEWLLARHHGAREQSARLLAFLTRRNAPVPPIWRSAQALDSAEAIRQQLTRGTAFRLPKVDHGAAHWTLGENAAVFAVPVVPADRTQPQSLQVSLVWHQDAWWVDAVSVRAWP